MKSLTRPAALLFTALLAIACDGEDAADGGPSDGAVAMDSGGTDAGPPDGQDGGGRADAGPRTDAGPLGDAGPLPDAGPGMRPADWPTSRGWQWVRDNPMFISALTVRMGAPPEAAVDRYFEDFGANAVHLWETGLPAELAGWQTHRAAAPWVSWLHSDATNRNNGMVGGGVTPGLAGRIGYQIGDEPVSAADMTAVLGGLSAIADYDPDGLRIVNFSYTRAEDIDDFTERFCASGLGDIASYDLYSRSNSHYEVLAYFRDVGLRCGMPYWRYIKGYVAGGDEEIQSESDMRWAAFIGLTYGYTGHTWFLYLVAGGDAEGIPTTFFDETENWASSVTPRFALAAQINAELEAYGRAMTQLLSTDVAWATDTPVSGAHPPVGAPSFDSSMDPYLDDVTLEGRFVDALLGFFVDERGDRYVIVQNPNHSDGSFPTNGDDRLLGALRFDFSSAPANVRRDRVRVLSPNGTVEVRTLTDGALPLDLPAGEILFFGYDTGRPFAGY